MTISSAFANVAANCALTIALAHVCCTAVAADAVLAESPEAVLTRADWDADMLRIPADKRDAFASSPQRVEATLNALLVNKTLAARARAAGLDKDPLLLRRIAQEAERILAMQMLDKIENDAQADFDRKPEVNLARAREYYLANGKRYMTAEEIEVSHILISTEKRDAGAALATATDVRAKLVAGADFAVLARELSDDPSVKNNGGHLAWSGRGIMDPAFEQASFSLANPGDLSAPVQSRFGYHIIRLDGRKPSRKQSFDEVKAQIIDEMRATRVKEARESAIATIKSDPRLHVDQKAVDALVVRLEIPANAGAAMPPAGSPAKGSESGSPPPAK